jgi:hypothetical protein
VNDLIVLLLSTTALTRRTSSPGLIKSFVIWTTSGLNHTNTWRDWRKYIFDQWLLQQYDYDAASQRFRDLRGVFKGICSVYWEDRGWSQISPSLFLKFANLKRNSSGYLLPCFWVTLVHVTHRKLQIFLANTFKVCMWETIHMRILLWTTVFRILPLFRWSKLRRKL